jgi:hypothetical protein
MHGPINVKSPNNTNKWQMGFNSAFKGLTCRAWGEDSTVKDKIIFLVTVHRGKLTNKDMTQILSRICARKLWQTNVNFYFIEFIAYFILVVVMRCTSLWENACVNCKYCDIASAITMETRSFLIAISGGNQEGNLRGCQSHEVNMHARPIYSPILPLAGCMTSLRVHVSVDSVVLTEAARIYGTFKHIPQHYMWPRK